MRVLFSRQPIGPALGALVPPRAVFTAAPVLAGSNVGNAPRSHEAPLPASAAGKADDYRAALLNRQRAVARAKFHTTH